MKKILFLLTLLVSISCNKEETLSIEILSLTDHEATVNWNSTNSSGNILYKIVLNNEVILEGYSSTQYTFTGLNEQTTYYGIIFQNNQDGNQTFEEFSFTTLRDTTLRGSYLVDTQEKADNFFYTSITQRLRIRGENIVDISNLSSLVEVGNLAIEETSLHSLNGLHNLTNWAQSETYSGSIHLTDNAELDDVSALSNLPGGSAIRIAGCPVLRNVSALSLLDEMNSENPFLEINIKDSGVESLAVYSNVRSLNVIRLEDLPNLTSINGLNNLESIEYELIFGNLPILQNISPLQNLQSVERFYLYTLPILQNISSLQNLQNADNFRLENLSQLSSLSGFNIQSLEYLYLIALPNLSNVSGLSSINLLSNISIYNNNLLTNLDGLSNLTNGLNGPIISVLIQNNDNLVDFCGLTEYMLNTSAYNPYNDQYEYYVWDNAYNPTEVQVESTTECSL